MRCPICGEDFNPVDAMMDAEWGDIFSLLPSFGGHSTLVFEYCEKFGVNPLRMKSKKILRLLREMQGLFQSGEFVYNRRKYSASNRVVIGAIEIVNNKHFAAPLENHNYLKKVMISLLDEEAKERSKREERALREKEERLRSLPREQRSEVGGQRSEGRIEEMTAQEYLASVGKKSLRG